MINRNIRTLVEDYILYINTIKYLTTLPKWKLALMRAGKSDKPITLAPSSMEAAKKAFDSLPSPNKTRFKHSKSEVCL